MTIIIMKKCPKCGQEKPMSEFYTSGDTVCKACRKIYRSERSRKIKNGSWDWQYMKKLGLTRDFEKK